MAFHIPRRTLQELSFSPATSPVTLFASLAPTFSRPRPGDSRSTLSQSRKYITNVARTFIGCHYLWGSGGGTPGWDEAGKRHYSHIAFLDEYNHVVQAQEAIIGIHAGETYVPTSWKMRRRLPETYLRPDYSNYA